jgi:hypothetical protein
VDASSPPSDALPRARVDGDPDPGFRGSRRRYWGPVVGMQWLEVPVSRESVRDACGVDGGHQGCQTVPGDKAIEFLRAVGLLP